MSLCNLEAGLSGSFARLPILPAGLMGWETNRSGSGGVVVIAGIFDNAQDRNRVDKRLAAARI